MEDLFPRLEDWGGGGNILHYLRLPFMYQCKLCEIGTSCSCTVLGFLLLCNVNVFSHCSCCLIHLIFMSFCYGHLVMAIYNACKAGKGSDARTYVFRNLDLSSLMICAFSWGQKDHREISFIIKQQQEVTWGSFATEWIPQIIHNFFLERFLLLLFQYDCIKQHNFNKFMLAYSFFNFFRMLFL